MNILAQLYRNCGILEYSVNAEENAAEVTEDVIVGQEEDVGSYR